MPVRQRIDANLASAGLQYRIEFYVTHRTDVRPIAQRRKHPWVVEPWLAGSHQAG
jgi:hypothetical protein